MTKQALLCPRCGRLIGSEESSCSWCGASRPATWLAGAWSKSLRDGDWLIKTIIVVNVAFYILSILLSAHGGGMLSPDGTGLLLLGETGAIPVSQLGRPWTLLTANYLHGGILHIFFNMMAFHQIAPMVNREYGTSRMFAIYTLGGVFGFWVSCMAGIPFTIGASAAVCALIGSLLYYGKSRGGSYGTAVYREVSGWVVGLFLFGFIVPGIDNWAHGGGIIGGIVLGMLMKYEERKRETVRDRSLALLCAVATVGALGWALITGFLLRFGN